MRFAVNLNRKALRQTGKVYHKWPEGVLTAKFETAGPFPQFPPKENFRKIT